MGLLDSPAISFLKEFDIDDIGIYAIGERAVFNLL